MTIRTRRDPSLLTRSSAPLSLAIALAGFAAPLAQPELTYASCPPMPYHQIVTAGLPDGTPAIVVIGMAGNETETPHGGRRFEVVALLRGTVQREIVVRPPIDQERVALEPSTRYVLLITPTSDGLLLSCKRPAVIDSQATLEQALSWAVHPVILDPTILSFPSGDAGSQVGNALRAVLVPVFIVVILALAVVMLLARRKWIQSGRGGD